MQDMINNVRDLIIDFIKGIIKTGERKATISFYNMKKKLFRFALEFTLFAISIIFILLGGVLLLNKYFAIEWIFLVVGLIMINFVLITAKFK